MIKQRTVLVGTLAVIGILTLLVLSISVLVFPAYYDTTEKIIALAVAALTGVLVTAKGIKDAFELFSEVFPQHITSCTNLPRPAIFLGRTKEVSELLNYLKDKRVKTILVVGLGGIGKSSLVQETVHRTIKKFPGGAVWISVRDFPEFTGESCLQELCKVLGVQRESLLDYLKTKPTVVVIDNAETANVAELRKVRNLIDSVPLSSGTKFVLTSRAVISLFTEKIDERVFYLHEGLDAKSAREYLVILSQKQAPYIDELIKAADWVVARVQGHPKVLEIIAGTTRLRGWERVRVFLESLSGELAERVEEIYSSSINLLAEESRQVLPYLTLLPTARYSLSDIIPALGDSSSIRAIERIADSGLISYDAQSNCIVIHQTVYDYLREHYKLEPMSRAIAYFRLAQHFGNQGDLGAAVWMWCRATGKDDVSLDTAISMWSETVRNWLKTRNQETERLTRAST
jgi:hypothetical protein